MNSPTVVGSEVTACETVVDAVAEATGRSPLDLRPPLSAVVDPDALDAVVSHVPGSDVEVTFEYCGHVVTVRGPEDVEVDPVDDAPQGLD